MQVRKKETDYWIGK